MERISPRSSIHSRAFGRIGHVRISGVINETFSPGGVSLAAEHLILDVGAVRGISSFGVRRWIDLVSVLRPGTQGIAIIHAPPVVVDQLNLIGNFAGVAQVLSVLAPYECPRCGPERLVLIDMTTLASRAAVEAGVAPERACPVCQQALLFSESVVDYFGFFKAIPRPTVQPIIEHFLRLLRTPDGLDSTEPFKLLQEDVTYYQLRGKVMPSLNVRRMTAGLEGRVVFDFARVSAVTAGARDRLAALLEQSAASAEVLVSRVPTSVLEFLSSAEPVKLLSVVLQGQCRVCGEIRPHTLPAKEHLQDCKRGPPPDRPCPICGSPSGIEAALSTGFLESHADSTVLGVLEGLQGKAFVHLLEEAAAGRAGSAASAQPDACSLCGERHGAKGCKTLSSQAQPEKGQTAEMARMDLSDLAGADSFLGRVVGNYRLKAILGEGASARVYLGEHTVIGSRVAVKILHQSLTHDAVAVARFIREARTISAVIHDNVVQVLDINTVDRNVYCIIMEYLDGQTLGDAFAQKIVPYEEAAPLLLQLCDGLAKAHSHGIVHRDLKPDNIYLLKRGRRIQIKIVDFGIARRETLSDGESRTMAGTLMGTPRYMSPEQAFSLTADSRADIYTLGVIMFELATGRLPFEGQSIRALLSAHCIETPPRPRSINPLIDPAYEQVILKTLAKDPKDRFQTMADLGRAIAQARPEGPSREAQFTPPLGVSVANAKPVGAALRRHPRLSVELQVDVELPVTSGLGTGVRERMTMVDISRGGALVFSRNTIPEVFTQVVIHPVMLGAQPLLAEVTRKTRTEDPETGVVVAGFGVSFIAAEDDAGQERTIQAILALKADASSGPLLIEAEINEFLSRIEAGAADDHYALLGIPLHANFPAVRNSCAHLARVLDSPQLLGLAQSELARVKKGRDRIVAAEQVLIDPSRRAAYDATRGNFVGVAHCLASGLQTSTLAKLREQFLAARPELPGLMQPITTRLDQLRATKDPSTLLEGLGGALRLDPLDIDLHTQYWDLRRKLSPDNE